MNVIDQSVQQACWTLAEYTDGANERRTVCLPLPSCIIGRSPDVDLSIPDPSVSKRHARMFTENSRLLVEDLGSTNGTFVNAERVLNAELTEGDLLQFANTLYRVGKSAVVVGGGTVEEGVSVWAETLLMFERLMTERAVTPFFQPIVTMDRTLTAGYELLARSTLQSLRNPAAMFGAAERLGQQVPLSELLRLEGIRRATEAGLTDTALFLNTHPAELRSQRLVESLRELRCNFPELSITIEIHEAAVTSVQQMNELKEMLRSLDMQLAYDDFGAGQGRLLELGEAPPDVLKFDMQLIRDIDSASASRQELLRCLVKLADDLGATPLAEGVETEAEHDVCVAMGFRLGQGFLYGAPHDIKPRP